MTKRNFTPFPVLETQRLTLRQLSIEDQHSIFALRSSEEVNRYLGRQLSNTIEDAIGFINRINKNIQENNSIYWGITLNDNGTFVGTICLFGFTDGESSCEIGYELLPAFQGKGLMTEAAGKVIEYAIQVLQFRTIKAFTHNDNHASTNLVRKFNFIKLAEVDKESPDCSLYTLAP